MYVIGVNDYSFINIIREEVLWDGKDTWSEIKVIGYDYLLDGAKIFGSYEHASGVLEKIKNNVEAIRFQNASLIGDLIDKDNSFDKLSYVKELKIYELVPVLFNDGND